MTTTQTPPAHNPPRHGRRLRLIAATLMLPFLAAACGLAEERVDYSYSCPETDNGDTAHLEALAFLDLTASGRDEAILADRLDVLQVELERVADCEGRATVIGFTSSTAAHSLLLDHSFDGDGATEIARDRNIPDQISSAMAEIRENIDLSLDKLPADGTDVNAIFLLAADRLGSIDPASTVELYGFTDGITTTGTINVDQPDLTPEQAIELADTAVAANLSGITRVEIRGIGKVAADAQPPTDYVTAVTAHVTELCRRATATKDNSVCSVHTTTVAR